MLGRQQALLVYPQQLNDRCRHEQSQRRTYYSDSIQSGVWQEVRHEGPALQLSTVLRTKGFIVSFLHDKKVDQSMFQTN